MGRNVFRRRGPVEPGPRRGRMLTLSVMLALVFAGLAVRAWYLQIFRNAHYMQRSASQHQTTVTLRASRGPILDRDHHELAVSAQVPSIYAVPSDIEKPAEVARTLAALLPQTDRATLERRLSSGKAFAWIARHVTPTQAEKVLALKIKGIDQRGEPRRFYPNRTLAGALIGFAGIDGTGLDGIERDYDRYLRGREYTVDAVRDASGRYTLTGGAVPEERLSGMGLVLTIDARIQNAAETALMAQLKAVDAKSGVVVVLDPATGDILAMAQNPPFDPNLFGQASPEDWRNRVVTDTLEPGSTVKPLLVASALDLGKIRADSVFDGHHGRMRVGKKVVSDTHPVASLNTLDIIKFSSNVGAVQVAQRMGKENYYRYLRAFGIGEATQVGLKGEQVGTLHPAKSWGLMHLVTQSYGYGMSVTAIQMARAYAAIANGGMLMRPRLVMEVRDGNDKLVESFPPRAVRRVVSQAAARTVVEGLIRVTTEDGGTGKRARVPGHLVAGKTGTAYKVDPLVRGYNKNKIRTSFAGFVPARAPRLVMFISIDEPQIGPRYGGTVAAPVFSAIAREILPYMGIEATEPYTAEEVEAVEEELTPEDMPIAAAQPWWFDEAALLGAPRTRLVPDLRGQALSAVVARAKALNLNLRIDGAGLVVSQRPEPGALLPADATLAVVLDRPGTAGSATPEEATP